MKGVLRIGGREYPCAVSSSFDSTAMYAEGLVDTMEQLSVYAAAEVWGTDECRHILKTLGEMDTEPTIEVGDE